MKMLIKIEDGVLLPQNMYDFITQKQDAWELENMEINWLNEYEEQKRIKYINSLDECFKEYLKPSDKYSEIENPNLYIPLSKKSHNEYFKSFDEQEVRENKAQQLITTYSEIVFELNIFEYWKQKKDKGDEGYKKIARAFGIRDNGIVNISYEKEFKIFNLEHPGGNPTIDICFEYDDFVIPIECKYIAPFNKPNLGDVKQRIKTENRWETFKQNYLADQKIW
jgi:hypothetical protein